MTVSGVLDFENLDLGVSDLENLDLGVSDFENLDLEISPMGRSIFYPQAYPKRDYPAGICIYNCYVRYRKQ